MKRGTIASILLSFLVLMVQAVGAVDVQMNGDVSVTGSVTATSFSGSGLGLTNLDPTKITSGTANINISGNAATATAATTASSVAPLAVTNAGLANDAVTPAKIAFYGKVAIVATSGGDFSNPAIAMSNYATWCGTPSATNPCLLKIMPGVYDVGASSVVMQPFIDIEGSGEKTTKITGAIDGTSLPPTAGIVQGASNAELRFLTVENTFTGVSTAILNSGASPSILHVTATALAGTFGYGVTDNFSSAAMTNVTATASGTLSGYGVYNSSSSPIMTNVTANASAGSGSSYGVYNVNNSSSPTMVNVTVTASGATTANYGVFNSNAVSPIMTTVTATASGGTGDNYGLYNDSTLLTMANVTVSASGGSASFGVFNTNGTVKISHSIIRGATNTINNASGVTLVGSSQLDGGAVSNGGTLTCAGLYDENFVFFGNNCP